MQTGIDWVNGIFGAIVGALIGGPIGWGLEHFRGRKDRAEQAARLADEKRHRVSVEDSLSKLTTAFYALAEEMERRGQVSLTRNEKGDITRVTYGECHIEVPGVRLVATGTVRPPSPPAQYDRQHEQPGGSE